MRGAPWCEAPPERPYVILFPGGDWQARNPGAGNRSANAFALQSRRGVVGTPAAGRASGPGSDPGAIKVFLCQRPVSTYGVRSSSDLPPLGWAALTFFELFFFISFLPRLYLVLHCGSWVSTIIHSQYVKWFFHLPNSDPVESWGFDMMYYCLVACSVLTFVFFFLTCLALALYASTSEALAGFIWECWRCLCWFESHLE